MKEGRNKSWEDCGKELYTFFKESLGIEEEIVNGREHRLKRDRNLKMNK